jgi:hypothetical protein
MGASTTIGRQISWGIPSGMITDVHTVVTAGTVAAFTRSLKGEKDVHTEEDGKKVGATFSGDESEVKIDVECMATTALPARGDSISGLIGADTGLIGGAVLVDSVEVAWKKGGKKMLSVSATHYPDAEV